MRKPKIIIALVASLAFGAYLLAREEPLYHTQSYVFGTLVDISIYGENAERASSLSNHILQNFQSLHNRLHAWKPTAEGKPSELGQLNSTFERGRMLKNVSPDLIAMLADAKALSIKSHGLFNPAIGHLIGTWGFQRDEFTAVDINDRIIKKLVKSDPSMSDIVLENNTAYSKNSAVKLDLGGYAKGYALDLAAQYLRKQHVNNALINIGGNIIAIGKHGDKPWRVGIQHPRAPTAIATIDLPDGWAVGTSGDYQRYFMLNGKRYCHIIDPRTGYPTQHTQSVTLLVPPQPANQTQAGVLSDVASKPIFIESPQNRSKAAQELGVENYMVIDDQANIFVSKSMVTKLNWLSPNVKFTTLQ
ncbi:FAD:protein FMN transferase [Methylotenera sp.]|uniref:FAD:protein FMN transferase n=1 Tax=Methylotenera sp. TaxID=2051956 RepID=UPI00248A372B|nr:FAD:protein FMN transferase [Methylotenera sp.]MDI1298848.1 FAD:protein FMN transferase [Methylotenera sp.]